MSSSSKGDGIPKGKKTKVPKVAKESEKVRDEGGNSPKAKSFARRDRPSKDPAAMQKWDSIKEAFNEEIREIVMGMGRSVSKNEERSRDHFLKTNQESKYVFSKNVVNIFSFWHDDISTKRGSSQGIPCNHLQFVSLKE